MAHVMEMLQHRSVMGSMSVPLLPRIGSFLSTMALGPVFINIILTTSCSSSSWRKSWPTMAPARFVEIPVPACGSAGARGEWY